MKKLYAHQQRFLDKNPDRALLVWEGGLGKTIAACEWMKLRPNVRFLVACPKSIIKKWKQELEEWGATADVVSRDQIKKIDLTIYGGIVLDECQDFAAPLFDRSRSYRAATVYNYLKNHSRAHVLLLTATPVRSTPYNIHTLACYLGIYWDIKKFREQFFYFTDLYGRWHWEKKPSWRKAIRSYIEEISDIVLMKDVVDVPIQHEQVIQIPWLKTEENKLHTRYLEPSAEWHERHRLEQGDAKWKEIERLTGKYRKVILVVYYRAQIEDYIKRIGDDRQVFVLHGGVKDQGQVIADAREADDCIFIVQASMSAGFDAHEFSVVIFASMSFKYVDYQQMKFRVKRITHLHENIFYYLIAGKCDKAVYSAITAGKDFDPIEYLAHNKDAPYI